MIRIPQMQPWFCEEEASAVAAYLRGGGWVTEHAKTREFEEAIANYTGAKHCIVVNNGTVSLTLAALALGVGPGDGVIVPAYSMAASAMAISMTGATPVFVDVEPDTLCLDFELAKGAKTPRTKAIVYVTANGRRSMSFDGYHRRCQIIEDAAQSIGSFDECGVHAGLFGSVGSFSFSAPKVISTGQGGALITDDDALARKLRRLKDFGRPAGGGTDVHESIGYNFKFTDVQAVIGLEQMKKLPWRVERKKEILRQYREQLYTVPQVKFFEQGASTPWFVDVLVERRAELAAHLAEEGIGTRVMYPPIPHQNAYQVPGRWPVAERVGRDGLWLPSSSQLTDIDIEEVCAAIREFYR